MASYIDLLRQYALGTPATPEPVPTQSAGPVSADTAYRVAAARNNGTGQSITDPLERDLIDLTPNELIAKYGPEQGLALMAQRSVGATRFRNDRYAIGGNTLGDTLSGVGLGVANTVGGLGSLAAGLISDSAGAWTSEKMGEFNEWAKSNQSDALNAHRRAYETTKALSEADNAAQFEQEAKTDGSFVAGLRRVGRDALSAVSNTIEDPTLLGDGLAEATGSLLTGAPLASAGRKVGATVIGQLRNGGILSRVGAVKAARLGEKLLMPGTIGAMEAGGAYQQTVQQVQGMSHDELMQNSPDYAELIQKGWSPEDALVEVATSAGLMAAAIQFPVAAAAGTLVSKFEANPLKVGSVGAALGDVAREGLEEGIQSGSGQLSGNLGVRAFANENQDLTEGVGEQVGLGALYGKGSAVITQTPGLGIQAAKGVGAGAVAVGKAAISPLQKRLAEIQAGREASSSVSEANLNERADTLVAEAEADIAQVDQAVTEQNLDTAKADLIKQRIATLRETIAFNPDELGEDMNPELREGLSRAKNRFDALRMASKLVKSTEIDPLDRLQAAIFVNEQLTSVGDKLQADLISAMDPLDDNDTQYLPELSKYDNILADILEDPEIQNTLEFVRQQTSRIKPDDLTEDKLTTPKGQQQAQAVATLAQVEPESVPAEVISTTLAHAKKGLFKVTPAQIQALETASVLSRTGETYKVQAQALKLANVDFVTREIMEDETPDGVKELSAAGHTKGILAAMRADNTALASELLQDMADFALHMQNKVDAFNRSYQRGGGSSTNRTTFKARNASLNKWYDSEGVWLDPKSKASLTLAQQAALDAEALGTMTNELIKQFGDLGVNPVSLVPLDSTLRSEPASMLARKFQKGKLTAPAPSEQVQEPEKVEPQTKAQPSAAVKTESKAPEPVEDTRPEVTPEPEVQSRISPEQAGRLTDAGLSARMQRLMAKGPIQSLSAEDQATFEVLDLELTRREDEAAAAEEAARKAEEAAKIEAAKQEAAKPVEAKPAPVVDERPEPVAQTDAKPETKPEPEQEVAVAPKTLSEAYPSLIGSDPKGKVKNWFLAAYKLPENARSRLRSFARPIREVLEYLQSNEALEDFLGKPAPRTITEKLASGYHSYLGQTGKVRSRMIERLNERLSKKLSSGSKLTIGQALLDGVEDDKNGQVNEFLDLKALNIVEEQNGKLGYNENLLQGAILAGMQWLIEAQDRSRVYDEEAIAKLLSAEEGSITPDEVIWFNSGMYSAGAKQDLAQKILKFWGLSENTDMPEGYVRGITEAVAAEVIRGLEATGMIYETPIQFIRGKPFTHIEITERPQVVELLASLQGFPNAIEQIVSLEAPDRGRYIGQPPENPPMRQLHGSPAKTKTQQREAATKAQNTPYKLQPWMLNFYRTLGESGLMELLGKGDEKRPGLNVNHALSIKGYNQTLRAAIRGIEGMVAEMENYAETNDMDLHEVPVYFEYGFTSVGRLMQLAKNNPQASKLIREVILPTQSTLDLSNKRNDHYKAYMLAMAQHLGEKPHKEPMAVTIKKIEDRLSRANNTPGKDLSEAVALLQDWVAGEYAEQPIELGAKEIQMLKDILGGDLTPGALHALVDYAQYLNTDEKGRKAFKTALYLEADGITDGPINSLMNLSSGRFHPDWLGAMQRGGFFLGSDASSMGQFAASSDDNAKDLYQITTEHFQKILGEMREILSRYKDTDEVNSTLAELMGNLLDDVVMDEDGNLHFKRGIAKNPLTVTVYGSGVNGIAAKITKALTDALYEELSGNNPKNPEILKQIHYLSTRVIEKTKAGYLVHDRTTKTDTDTGRGVDFTLTPAMLSNLQENVLILFAEPLVEAIDVSMGYAKINAKLVQRATQVQGIFFKYAYRQAIADALAQKDGSDGTKAKDFLSRKELDEIFTKLSKQFPFIDTGSQLLFVGGTQKSSVDGSSFGRDLNGKLRSDGFVYGPSNPGVSGIPYLVIATGDGQMILNALTGEEALDGVLPVYDGINLPLDKVADYSRRINKAVFDGWMRNPIRSLSNSFTSFVNQANATQPQDMPEGMLEELGRALRLGDEPTIEAAAFKIDELQRKLQNKAVELDARKAALAQVNQWNDHMASGSSPYVKTDGIELPGNKFQAIKQLNSIYVEELDKRKEGLSANRPKLPEGPSTDLNKTLEGIGRVDHTGTRVITREEIREAVDALDIPLGHKSLIRASINSLVTDGWTIRVGDIDQLDQHIVENGLNIPDTGSDDPVHGFAEFSDKNIYLVTPDSETLAHELLHAATLQKVYAYYAGQKQDARIGESVKRIEALMGDFLKIDPASITDSAIREEFLFAKEKIEEFDQRSGNRALMRASQLNEFMAWTLTNQNLIDLAKTQTKLSPLARITKEALALLKRLWKTGLAPSVGDDMFSNLRFNTLAIIQADNKRAGNVTDMVGLALNHAANPNSRLRDLNLRFLNRIAPEVMAVKNAKPGDRSKAAARSPEYLWAARIANQVQARYENAGFRMSKQQSSLFKTLLTAFAIDENLNGNAQSRLNEIYRNVMGQLSVESFMANPDKDDQADRKQANEKYRLVAGEAGRGKDAKGRSTIVPAFLALALVNDEFRQILSKLDVPKVTKQADGTVDGFLTDVGNEAMDRLGKWLVNEKGSPKVLEAIENLAERFAMSQVEDEAYLSQFMDPVGNAWDGYNDKLVNWMQELSQQGWDRLDTVAQNSTNKGVKIAAQAGQAAMGLFNEDIAGNLGRGWMSLLNKGKVWKPIHDLVNEVLGRTEDNASIYDMIKKVRSFVQQIRQHYREDLPGEIASQFSRPLKPKEWTAMFNGLAKTDLAALGPLGSKQVLELLRDGGKLRQEVRRLENLILGMDRDNAALIQQKAQELATYMNSGVVPANLLRNAEAIGLLLGEPGVQNRGSRKVSKTLVDSIDQLTTLYAVQGLDTDTRTMLAELAAKESKGLGFVFGYLESQRQDELSKSHTAQGRLNHYKGYVPTETASGSSLIVANDTSHANLLARGYQRVGKYEGSLAETGMVSKSYYFAPLAGRSRFNQGIVQNVRSTMFGVDPVTGFSLELHGAGRITGKQEVRRAKANIRRNGVQKEALLPVFDDRGDVIAYERSLDPDQLQKLDKETDLSRVLGIWRGRQAEEAITGRFNVEVVNNLKAIWDKKEAGASEEFINLLDEKSHKDKVIADAVSLFTPDMRRLIKDTFGADGFMVRKDMIDDVIGYRSASVGDVWTGNTRLDPKTIKVAENVLTAVFGKDAYKHLVTAEKLWQNFISDARTTIVVRSVIVPAANMLSNVYALAARGVPLVDILRGFPRKMNELHTHHQNLQMKVKLEAQIRAAGNDQIKLRPLKAKMKALEDSSKSLSIWPLIEAGEFSSVSEATVNREETTLFEGKLTDYLGQLTDKLPDSVKTAGKYALITKDTALFQGLQRAVEYGDFLAKAVLYDDLTKRKAGDPKKALAQISQEFINYDRLPGRVRGHMENMGLLWFWHFKLRSLKVALSTLRNNPLHLLFASLVPAPDFFGSVGMPLTDNIFAVGLEGKLDYSVGPDQAFHAFNLNPYVNLMN